MAEFKMTVGLYDEVLDMNEKVKALTEEDKEINADDVSTLKTSVKYIEQQKKILRLMTLYAELLDKDIKDIIEVMSEVEELDESLAAANR